MSQLTDHPESESWSIAGQLACAPRQTWADRHLCLAFCEDFGSLFPWLPASSEPLPVNNHMVEIVCFINFQNRLIGLVVRRLPGEWQTWVWFPLSPWIFVHVKSHQWLKHWWSSGYPARHYRVSTGTGWSSVSILGLGEVENLICNLIWSSWYGSIYNCLRRSIPEIR